MFKSKHTSPAPVDPVGWPLIQSLPAELNRMFDRFNTAALGAGQKLAPVIDISETDEAAGIPAEPPGVKPEGPDVSISDQTLVLKGHKSDTRRDRSKDWHRAERRFGHFRRQIPLGFAQRDGKVEATFDGGVPALRIAKPAGIAGKTRKIGIT